VGVRPERGKPGTVGRAADHHVLLLLLLLLRAFRERLRTAFARRGDVLFEITDALLTGGGVASALPLALMHRSAWKGNSANFALTAF
jgi:hypothetical protein